MLATVASYETPDPQTLVIKLSSPTSAFLDYLAAPYGPKVDQPDRDRGAHQGRRPGPGVAEDAHRRLRSVPDQRVDARPAVRDQRNDKWWGPKPYYEKLVMKIMPDASSQQLALEGGDLDFIHQQPPTAVDRFEDKSGFRVESFPSVLKEWIEVNPKKRPVQGPGAAPGPAPGDRQAEGPRPTCSAVAARSRRATTRPGCSTTRAPRTTPKYDPSVLKDRGREAARQRAHR